MARRRVTLGTKAGRTALGLAIAGGKGRKSSSRSMTVGGGAGGVSTVGVCGVVSALRATIPNGGVCGGRVRGELGNAALSSERYSDGESGVLWEKDRGPATVQQEKSSRWLVKS